MTDKAHEKYGKYGVLLTGPFKKRGDGLSATYWTVSFDDEDTVTMTDTQFTTRHKQLSADKKVKHRSGELVQVTENCPYLLFAGIDGEIKGFPTKVGNKVFNTVQMNNKIYQFQASHLELILVPAT